ncbi:MAG: leucine-rich repeat domain-containing protein [Treponema sp.]|nr:leucine-rich repeat domain-containing protein [Treponema sp.]
MSITTIPISAIGDDNMGGLVTYDDVFATYWVYEVDFEQFELIDDIMYWELAFYEDEYDEIYDAPEPPDEELLPFLRYAYATPSELIQAEFGIAPMSALDWQIYITVDNINRNIGNLENWLNINFGSRRQTITTIKLTGTGIVANNSGFGRAITAALPNVADIDLSAFNNSHANNATARTHGFGIGMFEGATNIRRVLIPNRTFLPERMFAGMTNLRTLRVSSTATTPARPMSTRFGLADENVINLNGYTGRINDVNFGARLFEGCTSIVAVMLPNRQTSNRMFAGCTSLSALRVGSSSIRDSRGNLRPQFVNTIDLTNYTRVFGDELFAGCTSIITVKLPRNRLLSRGMFDNCTNLRWVIGAFNQTMVLDPNGVALGRTGSSTMQRFAGRTPANARIAGPGFVEYSPPTFTVTAGGQVRIDRRSNPDTGLYMVQARVGNSWKDQGIINSNGANSFQLSSALGIEFRIRVHPIYDQFNWNGRTVNGGRFRSMERNYRWGVALGSSNVTSNLTLTINYYGTSTSWLTPVRILNAVAAQHPGRSIEQIGTLRITGNGTIASNTSGAIGLAITNYLPNLHTLDLGGFNGVFGNHAFRNTENIRSVILPDRLLTLGTNMFNGNINLTTLAVGQAAFNLLQNEALDIIDLRNFRGTFGSHMFAGCISIEAVNIPHNIPLANRMFENCEALRTLTVNGNPRDALDWDFYGIDLRRFQSTFGSYIFHNGESIETILLPRNIPLGSNMFRNCVNIWDVWLHPNQTERLSSTTAFNGIPQLSHDDSIEPVINIPANYPVGNLSSHIRNRFEIETFDVDPWG